ncbi:MAG: HPr family phosphocarrier protein [Pseudomonadota bacterium]
MIKKQLTLTNELGLHARASAKLVNITTRYASDIQIAQRDKIINAKNIMDLMLLAASNGTELQFMLEGEDEQEALEAIEGLIMERFGEEA